MLPTDTSKEAIPGCTGVDVTAAIVVRHSQKQYHHISYRTTNNSMYSEEIWANSAKPIREYSRLVYTKTVDSVFRAL